MNKSEFLNKLRNIKSVVCIAQFGSYGSEYWIKDRSDIDLAVIVEPNVEYIDTLDLEDEILEYAKELYNYDNVHLNFYTI